MVRIESITIHEFRGIRHLELQLGGKTFAICGPNGTGKSGVVDAVEFCLTGQISRLSGDGRGEVSLAEHGPHVDKRDKPEQASVTLEVHLPSLNKSVKIHRTVKTPSTLTVIPNEPLAVALLKNIAKRPEFVLSRRELIRYILATPGKRCEEVQALLRLGELETVRESLTAIANRIAKRMRFQKDAVTTSRTGLAKALGVELPLDKTKILTATNPHRSVLSLPALTDLTETTSLREGLEQDKKPTPSKISKTQAKADIAAAKEALAHFDDPIFQEILRVVREAVDALASNPLLAESVRRETFYGLGVALVTTEECPLCNTEWSMDALTEHIQKKRAELNTITTKRNQCEEMLRAVISALQNVSHSLPPIVRQAALTNPPVVVLPVTEYLVHCGTDVTALKEFLPLSNTVAVLSKVATVPQSVSDAIADFEKAVEKLPEPSKLDAAREWLTLAQERLENLRTARRQEKIDSSQQELAKSVLATYVDCSDSILRGLYSTVEKDFSHLYREINQEDEKTFQAKLVPSMGKLGFDVDFYGRGSFPPGAYHSEGHQDGMGLCLYIALMRYLRGSGFTLAVLDDVLMSVDAGHRREVCRLLKSEFPSTQFILTTHDPVWLRHMRSEGLLVGKADIEFRTWSVEHGPCAWGDRDVWSEINAHLEKNDVDEAAGLLRKYLEYEAGECCHRLRAPVPFNADGQYQLGDLLPASTKQLTKLYDTAKKAAAKWNQTESAQKIGLLETAFRALVTASNIEQWQMNSAIHYNAWATLVREDFQPVVEAFKKLITAFQCPTCSGGLRVTIEQNRPSALRCACGQINHNLQQKPD